MNVKVNLSINLSKEDGAMIERFLMMSRESEANTHGSLDHAVLIKMLLEDVALMLSRPGSWEGSNMRAVMRSHGYP